MHRFLCSLLLVLAGAAGAAASEPPLFPLAEVEPGLRGYGLSVFSGREPERFDVEVIGVWRNVRPGMDYILARLTGQGLEASGVVAGMSGSPVYFDERPAGAVAFSWAFAEEAIAGITPLEKMRRLYSGEGAGSPSSPVAAALELDAIARGDLDRAWLEEQLAKLAPRAVGGTTGGLGWVASGLGERTRRLLAAPLGELAAAGSGDLSAASLEPGSAVAAVLVDGDLRLAATGTVTDRAGDSVLAFGHPMFGLGSLEVPMAGAEVVTVVANQLNSFKVANVGPVEGAFTLDLEVGISGRIGQRAATIPVGLALRGEGDERFDVTVADLPAITPTLVAVAMLGALDSSTRAIGRQGIDLAARYDLGAMGRLEIEQSFDGIGAEVAAAVHLLAVTTYLLQNPLAQVELAELELEMTRHREPRTLRLVGAHADRSVVAPGSRIGLSLQLVGYRGEESRRRLELELPRSLPEGRYSLLVGDGPSMDAARLAIERRVPVTFSQALEYLQSLRSRRDLVVLGLVAAKGLSVAGETLPRLPDSVRSLWSGREAAGAQALELAVVQERVERLDAPLEGAFRVDLEIRRDGARE